MKRLLAAWMLLVRLARCWTIGLAEDAFEKETYYIHNDEMNRSIYAVQIKPKDLAEGEKVPLIIYVHGGNGTANSYIGLAKTLSEQKIAGLMFECCGGNNGKASAAKSDGADLFPAHYSSRISDLEAVLAFAKTLDFVDTNRVYLWGESYGGIVVEFCAVNHPNDVKGLLLVSTGLSDAVLGIQAQEETHHGILTKYVPDDPYQYILGYPGAVLFICGDADATGAYDNAAFNAVLYQQREQTQTDFVTIPDGGHGYGTFTKEQKQTTVDCILSWMAQ